MNDSELSLDEIKAFAAEWFQKLDEHAPSDQLVGMLDADGFEIELPEGTVNGSEGFRAWYEGGGPHPGFINLFFNERHTVSRINLTRRGEPALVSIAVNWKASRWCPPAPRCELIAFYALLEWEVIHSPKTTTPVIRRYAVREIRPVLGSPDL